MPLPATRTVVETYTNPVTGEPAEGTVILSPVPLLWTDTEGEQILAGGDTITLDETGSLAQALVTTDAAGVEPATGRLWRCEERIQGMQYRVRYFALPEGDGSDVPLRTVISADPGAVGYTPVEGPPGPAGPAGATGPAGPAGPAGATGPTGPAGETGPAGPQGETGVVGAQGPTGAAGPQGETGATGPVGPQPPLGGQGTGDTTALRSTDLLSAYKPADEPLPSSITPQDDDHLVVSVVANGVYSLDAYLDVEADAAADILLGWSVPAGASLSWTEGGISAGNVGNIGSIKQGRLDAATTSSVGIVATGSAVRPSGSLRVAGTAGTLRLRWAQAVSSATATTVKAGSWIRLTRIA